jgi:hypothetical protein
MPTMVTSAAPGIASRRPITTPSRAPSRTVRAAASTRSMPGPARRSQRAAMILSSPEARAQATRNGAVTPRQSASVRCWVDVRPVSSSSSVSAPGVGGMQVRGEIGGHAKPHRDGRCGLGVAAALIEGTLRFELGGGDDQRHEAEQDSRIHVSARHALAGDGYQKRSPRTRSEVDGVAYQRAGHAVSAATPAAQLCTDDGDDLDARPS